MFSTPVQEVCTVLALNPFNPMQIVSGHHRSLTAWTLSSLIPLRTPLVAQLPLQVPQLPSGVERAVLAYSWVEDSILVCSTKHGELMSVSIPENKDVFKPFNDIERMIPGLEKATRLSEIKMCDLIAPNDIQPVDINKALGIRNLTFSLVADWLPSAWTPDTAFHPTSKGKGGRRAKHSAGANPYINNKRIMAHSKPQGPQSVILSFAVTQAHLLCGTETGELLVLDRATLMPVLARQLFAHAAGLTPEEKATPCEFLLLNPTFTGFLSVSEYRLFISHFVDNLSSDALFENKQAPLFNTRLSTRFLGAKTEKHGLIPYGASILRNAAAPGAPADVCVMLWNETTVRLALIEQGQVLFEHSLPLTISQVACSPQGTCAIIGFTNGCVGIFDVTERLNPRLVWLEKLHKGRVSSIAFSPDDPSVVATMCAERLCFIHILKFRLMGCVNHANLFSSPPEESSMAQLAKQWREGEKPAASAVDIEREVGACFCWIPAITQEGLRPRIAVFSTGGTACVIVAPTVDVVSPTGWIDEKSLGAQFTKDLMPSVSALASPRDTTLLFTGTLDKNITVYRVAVDNKLTQVARIDGHMKPVAAFSFSRDASLLVTAGCDGQIALLHPEKFDILSIAPFHDASAGGVQHAVFGADATHLVSAGYDGAAFCWRVDDAVVARGAAALTPPVFQPQAEQQFLESSDGVDFDETEDYIEKLSSAEAQRLAKIKASNSSDEMLRQMDKFRFNFSQIMRKNNTADKLEKLSLDEFAIDLEMRDEQIRAGQERVEVVRKEIVFETKGKQLTRDRIIKSCWDPIDIKGQMFTPFQEGNPVHNFAVRARSDAEKRRIRRVIFLRRIELAEREWVLEERRKNPEHGMEPINLVKNGNIEDVTNLDSPEMANKEFRPDRLSKDARYVLFQHRLEEKIEEKVDAKQNPVEKVKVTPFQHMLGWVIRSDQKEDPFVDDHWKGAETHLLFHPLGMVSVIRKRQQILLLALHIDVLKRAFNAEFEKYFDDKRHLIETIMDRAKKIDTIQKELSVDEIVYKPSLSAKEIVDSVLKVSDSEIKSKKVLNKQEQEEFDAKMERERLAKASIDDGPERALKDMMNGTLEAKKDRDLLDVRMVPEPWMSLPDDQLTTEQKAIFAAFKAKETALREQQDAHRKTLIADRNKIKNEVSELVRSFDARLKELLLNRVQTQSQIQEHELIMIKLVNDVVKQEDRFQQEKALICRISGLSKTANSVSDTLAKFKKEAESLTRKWETMNNDVKNNEKALKKDFAEAGDQVETLLKIFRARRTAFLGSRQNGTAPEAKRTRAPAVAEKVGDVNMSVAADGEIRALNPFTPSEAERQAEIEEGDQKEEDDLVQPVEIRADIWQRFLQRRRFMVNREREIEKLELEKGVKQQHLDFLQVLEQELLSQLKEATRRKEELSNEGFSAILDADVLINMHQGEVEIVEEPVVTDLKHCEMIDRKQVEDLNAEVRKMGGEKVEVLMEIKRSNTKMHLNKWTLEKRNLEYKDQVDLTTTLHVLRVTKELQGLIKAGGRDNQKSVEVKNLNRKIEFLSQSCEDKIEAKNATLGKYGSNIRSLIRENERLSETAKQLESAVRERLTISQIRRQEIAEETVAGHLRMKAIVTRRKLVDLAKLQSEEVHFLRDQVETLRKRTFASFALPSVSNNPDDRSKQSFSPGPGRSMSSLSHLRSASRTKNRVLPARSQSVFATTQPGTTLPKVGDTLAGSASPHSNTWGGSGRRASGSNVNNNMNKSRSQNNDLSLPGRSYSSMS